MNRKPCSVESALPHEGKFTGCAPPGGKTSCHGAMKKHPCPDCTACQFCSDTRCRSCRGQGPETSSRMSMQEQIALYNERNKDLL